MRFLRIAAVAWTALLLVSSSADAQEPNEEAPPGYLALVDGRAFLSRDGERDVAAEGHPVIPGDILRTERGRIHLAFPDGSTLDLDEFSTVELLSETLFRLSEGRLRWTAFGAGSETTFGPIKVDTLLASATLERAGEYRLSLRPAPSGMQVLLEVVRGRGTLFNDRGTTALRAGEESVAWNAAAPSYPRTFNSARVDAFDLWATTVRQERVGTRSAQYLPADLRMYGGVLERSGTWEHESSYGYVWYPQVAQDWRPYDDGYWSSIPDYGWTWIGAGAWSWPTHHYGRWGHQRNRWFWIPERHWAPAWVSWGAAPGYVSWCPLGYDNRPVFALSVSTGDRWGGGWTVMSRDQFGRRGENVRRHGVRALPSSIPFITQTAPPLPPARGSRDHRIVGRVPRVWTNGSAGLGTASPRPRPSTGFPDRSPERNPREAPSAPSPREVRPMNPEDRPGAAGSGGAGRRAGRRVSTRDLAPSSPAASPDLRRQVPGAIVPDASGWNDRRARAWRSPGVGEPMRPPTAPAPVAATESAPERWPRDDRRTSGTRPVASPSNADGNEPGRDRPSRHGRVAQVPDRAVVSGTRRQESGQSRERRTQGDRAQPRGNNGGGAQGRRR